MTFRLTPLRYLGLFLVWIHIPLSWAGPQVSQRRPAGGGAVASADVRATETALDVLATGGNAADAAVAASLVLAVVFPQAGNLGGGGFAVLHLGGKTEALDFREQAPAAAHGTIYLDSMGDPRPGASTVGPLAAGVPGSALGLHELHRRHGRLPWTAVVAPAERLARKGFRVSQRLHAALLAKSSTLLRFEETEATWFRGGAVLPAGAHVKLPALARTLRQMARQGPKTCQDGPASVALLAASRLHGGILSPADLRGYRPVWRDPILFELAGWDIASMPLPSSGGILLAQTSGILERLNWSELQDGSTQRAHLFAEACRRSYADRFLMGDPRSSAAGPLELLAPTWLDRRAAEIDLLRAGDSSRTKPWPAVGRGESDETTHLSVTDSEGGTVALTTTLNGSFGCGLWVPEIGFLNNEMDDFSIAPGRPNLYGLIQGPANEVRPGYRMLSSMSPTVAWRGSERLALGASGGSRIPTATLQVLWSVLIDGEPLTAAVARPRLHHQWLPDVLQAEEGALSPAVQAELELRGHELRPRREVGELHAVRTLPGGQHEAAADPRGPGSSGMR